MRTLQPLILLLTLFTMACATVTRTPLQRVEVESQPSGASIRLSECSSPARTGTTPTTVIVSRRATRCTILISKPGYEQAVVHLQRKPAPPIPYDLTPGTIATTFGEFLIEAAIYAAAIGTGELVDFASGAKYMLDPPYVGVTLERTPMSDEGWRDSEPEPDPETEPESESESIEPPA